MVYEPTETKPPVCQKGERPSRSETIGRGATWHRIDLHLHSPQILAFVPPKGTKREDGKALADAYVDQLGAQGISIAAITDYNEVNIEWFEVTAAKATNRGIALLPGVEMTFRQGKSGLHLLAIFPGDTDLKGLNAFVHSLDKDPGTPMFDNRGSHRDIDLKINLTDALKDLRSRFRCLLSPSTPRSGKRALQESHGRGCRQTPLGDRTRCHRVLSGERKKEAPIYGRSIGKFLGADGSG